MPLQAGCLFSSFQYPQAEEVENSRVIFTGMGAWEWSMGKPQRKVFPLAILFHFPQGNYFLHHLSQLTSTSTLGPNWMWTLSEGIGLTRGIRSSIPIAFWWGLRQPCGRKAGGQTPPQLEPRILYASWLTINTVTMNQLGCGEPPWNLHIRFPSGWRLQVCSQQLD